MSFLGDFAALSIGWDVIIQQKSFQESFTATFDVESHSDPVTVDSKWEDFVLLAEFSEVEGPVALVTIPRSIMDSSDRYSNLDVNRLLLAIMSTDYQTHSQRSHISNNDICVLRQNLESGVHAYIHYFTLYDLHARGFVRPVCLAYLTRDFNKLDWLFSSLQEKFYQVTGLLRLGNHQWFENEVTNLQSEVNMIQRSQKQVFCDEKSGKSSSSLHRKVLPIIVSQLQECQLLLQNLNKLQTKSTVIAVFELWRRTARNFHGHVMSVLHQCMISVTDEPFTARLHPLSIVKWLQQHRRPDSGTSQRSRYCASLRPFTVITGLGLVASLWALQRIQNSYSYPTVDLKLRNLDIGILPSFLVPFKGGVSHSNRRKCHIPNQSCLCDNLLCILHPSKNDIECYLQSDSLVSILQHFKNSTEQPLQSPSVDDRSFYPIANSLLDFHMKSTPIRQRPRTLSCSDESRNDSSLSQSFPGVSFLYHSPIKDHNLQDGTGTDKSYVAECEHNKVDTVNSLQDQLKFGEILEETRPTDEVFRTCNVRNLTHVVDRLYRRFAGFGIHEFVELYGDNLRHVLLALWSGQTVVVAGSDASQELVLCAVTALRGLVIGHDSYSNWHTGLVVPEHTQQWSVVGLCVPERMVDIDMVTDKLGHDVVLFNVESRKFYGAAYAGNILSGLTPTRLSLLNSDCDTISCLFSILAEAAAAVYCSQNGSCGHPNGLLRLDKKDWQIVKYMCQLEPDPWEEKKRTAVRRVSGALHNERISLTKFLRKSNSMIESHIPQSCV